MFWKLIYLTLIPLHSVGFTDSEICNFAASNSVILHEYLLWKREKREANMATEKIDITDSFNKFLTTYKQTHVSVNGQQARRNKERKRECCNKTWSPKTYVAVEMNVKKRWRGSIVNFLPKPLQRKVSYLLICYNHTNIYSPMFCKLFKHYMKGMIS